MARAEFKGSITTTGRSDALRLDKALFKMHPEFRQKAKIRASVVGPGSLLITLQAEEEASKHSDDMIETDPVAMSYLAFLERDMRAHPERLRPFTEADISRLRTLLEKVRVSDDDIIPDDVTL